ncbi:GATA transcription factor 4 [Dendrobium catenatum]|uniref:GATA transcription factor 4 n=1 Tax=Dendrobium catenatum TaxID=906689 RepID=A0A2I0XI11_9ASPA|nr:GATA transcription factor 4 [Dendrobium catenatum]PKU87556.1 GATA transcription factor 4 [Dendrobium catenatum]
MMETGWEIDFGMGKGMEMTASPATFAGASPAYMYSMPNAESLRVDELLDFTNHDLFPSSSSSSSSVPTDEAALHLPAGQEFSSSASVAATVGFDASLPDDICIPSEEAAELEWLSKFMEDSFSDTPYHYSLPDMTMSENSNYPSSEISTHALASGINRSPEISTSSSSSSSSSSSDFPKAKTNVINKKKQGNNESGARRCTHCSSEKTPQWRTGPLGPKTLCNACGVRFKSGRLVPEYRPAASPTFVLTQHSNSHRKVMELRRQKEFLILRGSGGGGGDGGSSGFSTEMSFQDYEVC